MRVESSCRVFIRLAAAMIANFAFITPAQPQVRGLYPPGMSATNSGAMPEAGISYSNLFVFFSRDEEKGPHGEIVATGQNSIMMDMNSIAWASNKPIHQLGGAVFAAVATLPIANNSLTSDVNGPLNGGGGFADSYYQPLVLGWRTRRMAIRALSGFLAPTGRFSAGATTNVGSGYWTPVVASGQTVYLDRSKTTALSAFQMYEFHTTQAGTMIHPGQTFDLDYSLTQTFALKRDLRLQVGLAGYGQWQTTDKSGPNITQEQASAHYKVNALGFAANALLAERKVSVGIKYFHEFECRSTFQGYTLQISGGVTF